MIKNEKNEDTRPNRKNFRLLAGFVGCILLCSCISTACVSAVVLPRISAVKSSNTNEDEKTISAAKEQLVRDTVKSSVGEYLQENSILVTDEDVNEISRIIMQGVEEQTSTTEVELQEIEKWVEESIQNINEYSSVENKSEITVCDLTRGVDFDLKSYIDNEVVPSVVASIQMNTDDIIEVNERLNSLGDDYECYKTETDCIIDKIQSSINSSSPCTDESIVDVSKELSLLCEKYDAFVENVDSEMEEIHNTLDEKVKLSEFESFKEKYEAYKEDVGNTVSDIEVSLGKLNEEKADQSTVALLTENFNNLQSTYASFTGADGEFAVLNDRVTSNETVTADLEERIEQLENELENAHPVGSLYMSFGDENPAELYGGTWKKVEDTFLMCAGSTYPVGSAGGNNTVTLSAENIPELTVSGSTNEKKGVSTTENGSYDGTITTNGSYAGGTYASSVSGDHTHSTPNGTVFMSAMGGNQIYEIVPGAVSGSVKWLWPGEGYSSFTQVSNSGNHSHTVSIPGQTIISKGNLSIENHSHIVDIPSLDVTGSYENNNLQGVDITNKYVAVNVWKRIS